MAIFPLIAAGAASGLASSGLNYFGNKSMMAQEQRNYEKNQAESFRLSQLAQQQAVPNAVKGLKEAGLNPASAAQGAFGGATMSSPPMQNKSVQPTNFPIAEMVQGLTNAKKTNELLDAQKDNINADTANKLQGVETGKSQVGLNEAQGEKLRAETQLSQYQYRNQRNIDSSIFENLMNDRKEDMARYFKSLGLDVNNPDDVKTAREQFSAGSLLGENTYFKLSADKIEEMNRAEIAREFETKGMAEIVGTTPYYERQKLIHDTAHVKVMAEKEIALREKLQADASLSQQQRLNLQKEIQKIDADIGEIKARTERVSSEKFRNYAIGGSAIADSAWDIVETFLPKGFVKKAAKGVGESSPMREKTTTTYKETKTGWKHEVNKERFPMSD